MARAHACMRMYACVLRVCEMCKRKWSKATLSWLRLVCCRHEVPVTSEPITVIHMDEDVVVVNKPASIPVSGVLPELYCQKEKRKCLSHCLTETYIYTCTHARTRTRHTTTRAPHPRMNHTPRIIKTDIPLESGRPTSRFISHHSEPDGCVRI